MTVSNGRQIAAGNTPQLLTSKEAAARLRISERTLWTITKSSALPSIRIGRSVRYSLVDLEHYVESHRTGGRS
jgi:excisionase family DNA binding protein